MLETIFKVTVSKCLQGLHSGVIDEQIINLLLCKILDLLRQLTICMLNVKGHTYDTFDLRSFSLMSVNVDILWAVCGLHECQALYCYILFCKVGYWI